MKSSILLIIMILSLISLIINWQKVQGRRFAMPLFSVFFVFSLVIIFLPLSPNTVFELYLLIVNLSLITLNALAVALSVFYTSKIKLYANLPENIPGLPFFGPEVKLIIKLILEDNLSLTFSMYSKTC